MDTNEIKDKIRIQKMYFADCVEDARTADEALKLMEAELAEAEKAELRHLDFGDTGDDKWIKLFDEIHWIGRYKQDVSVLPDADFVENAKGNLQEVFARLEAIAVPLSEFTTDVYSYRIDSKDYPGQPIRMAGNHHSITEVEEHILKLRRLVATYQRQKNDS